MSITNANTDTKATPVKAKRPSKKATKVAKVAKPLPAKAPVVKTTKSEVTFRPGTKRRSAFDALTSKSGISLEQGVALLGWSRHVVGSEYREIAVLLKRKLERTGDMYRLA